MPILAPIPVWKISQMSGYESQYRKKQPLYLIVAFICRLDESLLSWSGTNSQNFDFMG